MKRFLNKNVTVLSILGIVLIFLITAATGSLAANVSTSSGTDETNLTNSAADDWGPVWSSDGTKIAFVRNYEIYVMKADGSDQTRLTYDGIMPSWSPNGLKIAYSGSGGDGIYVMNADGSDQTRLTNGANSPMWSPDGSKIAYSGWDYTRWDRVHYEIYIMNADGSGQTRLTQNDGGEDAAPKWSPDGSKIAFATYRDGNHQIYVMNADGSGQTNLTNNTGDNRELAWSPDGSRVAFTSYRDGDWGIYIMNADGSGQTRLTNDGHSPTWSPDGLKIAYRESDGHIHIMNADGSGQTRLTQGHSNQDPRWSPDGSKIAFLSHRDGNTEIYSINVDGGGLSAFKSKPDGWLFPNYSYYNKVDGLVDQLADNGYLPPDSTAESVWNDNKDYYWALFEETFNKTSMRNFFGDPTWRSKWVFDHAYKKIIFGGHCDGFASSSLSIFMNQFNARDPEILKGSTYYQSFPKAVNDHVAGVLDMYQSRQLSVGLQPYGNAASTDISAIYEDLKRSLSGQIEPSVLSFIPKFFGAGHTIVPERLGNERVVNEEVHIDLYLYDNNYPNEDRRAIDFNLTKKTFSYEWVPDEWYSSSNSNIILTPISQYDTDDAHKISFWHNKFKFANIYLSEGAQAVYSNESGQITGYKDGMYHQQIPDSLVQVLRASLPGEEDINSTITKLPAGYKYTAELKGMKNGEYDYGFFADDSLISIDDASVTTASEDRISVGENAESLTLKTNDEDKTFTASFDKESLSDSKVIRVKNTHLKKGETSSFATSDDYKTFAYKNDGQEQTYNLELQKISEGTETIEFSNIKIPSNTKQIVKLSSWDDLGESSVSIETYDANGKLTNSEQLYYYFHDERNNTSLSLNLHNKDFQFSVGDIQYPLIHDPKMKIKDGKIWINYRDSNMILQAFGDTSKNFGSALFIDLANLKAYPLLSFN